MEATIGKVDYLENQSHQANLHFEGITESPCEDWESTARKVSDFVMTKLNLSRPSI